MARLVFLILSLFAVVATANPVLGIAIGFQALGWLGAIGMSMNSQGVPDPAQSVGQPALSVTIQDPSNPSGSSARIPTTTSPDSSASIPPPTVTTHPPSPSSQISYQVSSISPYATSGSHGDMGAACSAFASAYGAAVGYGNGVYSVDPYTSTQWFCRLSAAGNYHSSYLGSITNTTGCPSGYSLVNGACVLTSPRQVESDGKTDYARSGTSYSVQPDIDVPFVGGYLKSTANPNDTVVFSGQSPTGEARSIQVQAMSSGGSQIKVATQRVDSGGRTYVENLTYDVNASGTIAAASSTTDAQSLVLNAAGTGYDVVTGPSNTFTPAVGSGQSPQFPSDYAKTGEAAAAAKSITDRFDATFDVGDPTLPHDHQFGDTFFKDTFTGLLSWQLPAHSSSCPVGSFGWNGSTYLVDTHCQLINNHWNVLQQAMAVVWIIAALFVVLRA